MVKSATDHVPLTISKLNSGGIFGRRRVVLSPAACTAHVHLVIKRWSVDMWYVIAVWAVSPTPDQLMLLPAMLALVLPAQIFSMILLLLLLLLMFLLFFFYFFCFLFILSFVFVV